MTLARAMLILRFISVAELDNEKEGAGILSKFVISWTPSHQVTTVGWTSSQAILQLSCGPRKDSPGFADCNRKVLLLSFLKLLLLLKRKRGTSVGCQKRWDMFTAWPLYGESRQMYRLILLESQSRNSLIHILWLKCSFSTFFWIM